MPLNTRGLSNNLTWTLFTLVLPPSALWGTLTGAWRHNVLFRRATNVQLSSENLPQPSGYSSAIHQRLCPGTETDIQKQNRSLYFYYIYLFCSALLSKYFSGSGNMSTKKNRRWPSINWICFILQQIIKIFRVEKVSRNPTDYIMNVLYRSMSWNQIPQMI